MDSPRQHSSLFNNSSSSKITTNPLLYNHQSNNKKAIIKLIRTLLGRYQQPSAQELLTKIENELGIDFRWDIYASLQELASDHGQTKACRQYCNALLEDGSLDVALRGKDAPEQEVSSTIDSLLIQCKQYKDSKAFQEMIDFMGRFRDYAPYNNLLVKLQNPSCSFYATARDWHLRFKRKIKEDAHPMLILAPMHPVMLVYDIDQTEGEKLPDEINKFAQFTGKWQESWMARLIENAKKYLIRVDFKELSSTHGGFATLVRDHGKYKMRIAIHNGLDNPSRLGVLCHELAHIFLGHLGTDAEHWWPSRTILKRSSVEIEAEAVAYIVTNRLELSGSSAAYVSRYLPTSDDVPQTVSVDYIAKVAGKLERMVRETVPRPKSKSKKKKE